MKSAKNSNVLLFIVVFIVCVINVIQGAVTELLPDEAYYWMYRQHIDWGFFDHPPAVAIWVYISELFFSGEMGVRFFSAISYSITLWFVWKTIDHPKKKEYTGLFLVVFLSSVLLSVYGFITTPDAALMPFYAIFLYAYHLYLKKKNTLSYLLLAVSIAGMMYSKYQGILIVFFVIISNLKLMRDPRLWLASLFALVLYIPHLYWQWANDFPSLKFHLVERGNRVYKFEHTLMHFVNVIVIVGITFPIIYKAFFKGQRTKDLFHKGLNYIIWGFIIFFFLSTFKGHVQAQWILAIAIPLILITVPFLIENEKSRKWFVYLACINFAVMIVARVQLVTPIFPLKMETHGNEQWANELKEKTQGKQKVFINSYRHTSAYWFYAQEKAYYLKNYSGRNNHFLLLQKDLDISSNEIALIRKVRENKSDIGIHTRGKDSIFAEIVPNFQDLSQIRVKFINEDIVLTQNGTNSIAVEIESSFERTIRLDEFTMVAGFMNATKKKRFMVDGQLISDATVLKKGTPIKAELQFDGSEIKEPEIHILIGIGLYNSDQVDVIRVSNQEKYQLQD
jgi:hypothetical protein